MEKKYTLEELDEFIDDDAFSSDFKLIIGIQNIIAIDTMRKNLFK